MREHGVPNYPDPTFPTSGGISIQIGPGVNAQSPAFQQAEKTSPHRLIAEDTYQLQRQGRRLPAPSSAPRRKQVACRDRARTSYSPQNRASVLAPSWLAVRSMQKSQAKSNGEVRALPDPRKTSAVMAPLHPSSRFCSRTEAATRAPQRQMPAQTRRQCSRHAMQQTPYSPRARPRRDAAGLRRRPHCSPRKGGLCTTTERCSPCRLASTGRCTTPDVAHRLIPPGRCRAKAVGRSEISARARPCGARRSAP